MTESADASIAEGQAHADEDRRKDVRALLTIFCALVLGAVHFASGWSLDLPI